MDRSTHQIRLASWKTVVEQCNSRPQGASVKQHLRNRQTERAATVLLFQALAYRAAKAV